jgi:hypothetical protein
MTRIDGANYLEQGCKSFKRENLMSALAREIFGLKTGKAGNSNTDIKQKFYLIVSNIRFNIPACPSKQEKS